MAPLIVLNAPTALEIAPRTVEMAPLIALKARVPVITCNARLTTREMTGANTLASTRNIAATAPSTGPARALNSEIKGCRLDINPVTPVITDCIAGINAIMTATNPGINPLASWTIGPNSPKNALTSPCTAGIRDIAPADNCVNASTRIGISGAIIPIAAVKAPPMICASCWNTGVTAVIACASTPPNIAANCPTMGTMGKMALMMPLNAVTSCWTTGAIVVTNCANTGASVPPTIPANWVMIGSTAATAVASALNIDCKVVMPSAELTQLLVASTTWPNTPKNGIPAALMALNTPDIMPPN